MPGVASMAVVGVAAAGALVLFQPRLVASRLWRATVTPLASIIGSGFLILAPILLRSFGAAAPYVMAGMCAVAYAIGAAIRTNIGKLGDDPAPAGLAAALDRSASWLLAVAYVITVTYYLNLFGAFSMSLTAYDDAVHGRMVTSVALILIGVLGWTRGFRGLEWAEELAVATKLSVIAGLLAGLACYVGALYPDRLAHALPGHLDQASIRVALGLLITVQGFETSRYLGGSYSAAERIRTMRLAQWISTFIYVTYIALCTYAFPVESIGTRETAVVEMTRVVSPVLPLLLVVAALSAQFSAAVADTNGCGGLLRSMSGGRISTRFAYVGLVAAGLAMTWATDIYHIISIASRAFALYYALQCALAAALHFRETGGRPAAAGYVLLAVGCLLAALFGLPAE